MEIKTTDIKNYNNLYSNSERKEIVAKTIEALRKSANLQQKQVAEYLGINAQTYGTYEKGRNEPPMEILVRISILYDIPLDILLQRDNFAKNKTTAIQQIDNYDKQIEELKAEMLKGNPEASKVFSQLLDELSNITTEMKKYTDKMPEK